MPKNNMKRNFYLLVSLGLAALAISSEVLAKPVVQWSVNVDQRLPNAPVAMSTPAVLQSNSDGLIVLGGRDGAVHVYKASGSEQGRFPLGKAIDSGTLALDNGMVVLGDTAGVLYVVDPLAEKVEWQYQLTSTFTSSPVKVEGGFLVQTTDNRVYRFANSGEKLWSYSGSGNALSMYATSEPLVVGNRAYAFMGNGDVVALSLDGGDLLWKRQLLLSNDSQVLSELKAAVAAPLLVSEIELSGEHAVNTLLISFYQGEMFALSARDGTQSFSLPISMKSAPLIVDSTFYAADSHGNLYAYNIKTGAQQWQRKISGDELVGPVVWNGSLWVADSAGVVHQLNMQGEKQGDVSLAGNIARLPIVTEQGILIRTVRGAMYMVSE